MFVPWAEWESRGGLSARGSYLTLASAMLPVLCLAATAAVMQASWGKPKLAPQAGALLTQS